MPPPTDGPPVKWITHDQHKTVDVWDCQQCGERVGEFIQEDLKIGAEGSSASPKQTLQYSDVIISGHVNVSPDVSSDAAHEIMELIVVGDTETRLEERLAKMLTFKGAD
nr:hypothetical protein BaRGS_007266 [Batillaria attramentaria]